MTQGSKKLDCFVSVITPENIEFEYALAGPFQRLPAFLFDVGVRGLMFLAIMFVGSYTIAFLPLGGAVLTVMGLVGYFLLSWFYGVFFETRFNGRTIGKMVFRLRAISTDGRPINASQAFLRNLLRLADMCLLLSLQVISADAPPFYGIPTMVIGFTTMALTSRSQRLGDLAAGTMVISEQHQRTPWNLQPDDKRAFGLAELIPATFQPTSSLAQTVGLYMENRKRLSPLRRNDVARHLAVPLIRQFELLPDTSPDLLLCALYVRTYMSAEQQAQGKAEMRRVASRAGRQDLGRPHWVPSPALSEGASEGDPATAASDAQIVAPQPVTAKPISSQRASTTGTPSTAQPEHPLGDGGDGGTPAAEPGDTPGTAHTPDGRK